MLWKIDDVILLRGVILSRFITNFVYRQARACGTEVAEADLAVVVDEEVGRLDVTMHQIRRVQEINCA